MFTKLQHYHIYETKYGLMLVMSQKKKIKEVPEEISTMEPKYKGRMNFRRLKKYQKKKVLDLQYGAYLYYSNKGMPQRFKEKDLVTRL